MVSGHVRHAASARDRAAGPPRLLHVATVDMTLSLLLGPQLRAFADAGYEVYGASAPGPYAAELEADGIRHIPLRHATRAMAPARDAALGFELAGVFRRLRPDIVHTHNPKPGWWGRPIARAVGVPAVVNTVHGLYALPADPAPKRALVYGLERMAAACSHAELVQNPEDMPTLERIGVRPGKLHLLGNGIDLQRFNLGQVAADRVEQLRGEWGAGPGDVVCGVVARLVAEKGFREIFAAAELLRRRAPNVRWVVVGPRDDDKSDAVAAEEIEQARVAGIRFLGARSDMEDLYAAMDLYALATYREGFPRSAMEAAAMRLPIVATDIRGCRQVVEHKRTGLLVPARQAEPLAAAVARLAGDAALRDRMGRAGERKAAAEFDQRRVIDLTLDVYDRLLGAAAGRPARAAQAPESRR